VRWSAEDGDLARSVLAKIPLYFDEEARLPGIGVVIVSYAIGYRRGRRGVLIKCPWLGGHDRLRCRADGWLPSLHRAHDERPAHVEPVEGPSTIQGVGNQQDLAADGTEMISEVRALIERHLLCPR
jgi:hypothetical protein